MAPPHSHSEPGAAKYIGVDARLGPSADLVCSADALPFVDGFDTILCCEILEHDPEPLAAVAEMRRSLYPGDHLIGTRPANGFPLHSFPHDSWRLMSDACEDLIF